jgi:hypothetical protein
MMVRSIDAQARYEAIAALVDLTAQPADARFPHLMPDGQKVKNWREAEQWSAARVGRSLRTIQRLWAAFRDLGEAGLKQRPRSDKGISRFFRSCPKAAIFAAYLYLAWTKNCRTIQEAILRNAQLLCVADTTPSYETVRVWLRSAAFRSSFVPDALIGQACYRTLISADAMRGLLDGRKRLVR